MNDIPRDIDFIKMITFREIKNRVLTKRNAVLVHSSTSIQFLAEAVRFELTNLNSL